MTGIQIVLEGSAKAGPFCWILNCHSKFIRDAHVGLSDANGTTGMYIEVGDN